MKNVLITGTTSGFGKATANHLSNLGYNVAGTSRNPLNTDQNYKVFKLDVRDDQSVQIAVNDAIKTMGSIDILINNAGYGLSGPIEETSIEEAKEQLEVNFWGTFRMTKAVLPSMRKQQKGLIINISSLAGLIGLPFQGFYSVRVEVKPFGIHVVNINPGDYHTSATQNRKIVAHSTDIYKNKFNRVLIK